MLSQTNLRRKGRKKPIHLSYLCPIEQEILAHARATDLMRGREVEHLLPEARPLLFRGRRPWWAPASFWGGDYYDGTDLVVVNTHFELPADMVVERSFPRHSAKDLVIWTDEFAFIRVPCEMEIWRLPRDEAMAFLSPQWDEFVHKGVVELAAKQPGDSAPNCAKKRGRRKASRPSAGEVEVEEAWDECLTPPPSIEPKGKRKHGRRKANRPGAGGPE